ncbi:MAG: aminotransferase class IV [Candidatus Limnocylindrales bacterium]
MIGSRRDRRPPGSRGADRLRSRRLRKDHRLPGRLPDPRRPPGRRTRPASVVVQAWPVVEAPASHLERGLRLVTSRVRRDPQDPLASLKTTSRAEYVYARLEARRAGADDAVFLTIDGHLSESTSANLFLVRRSNVDGEPGDEGSDGDAEPAGDGDLELATPSLDCAILPGTTRSWLLDWAGVRRPASDRDPAGPSRPVRRRARRSSPRAWPGSCP